MLKFKIGDLVEITANDCYHGFNIGDHVRITNLKYGEDDAYYDAVDKHGNEWSFDDTECKAVEGDE